MARSTHVAAPPPPTPTPTPVPSVPPVDNDHVAEGATRFSADEIAANAAPNPDDGTVPAGQGAGNLMPDKDDVPVPTPTGNTGEEVQPEIGGEPIKDSNGDDVNFDNAPDVPSMAGEAFATLATEPFDPSTNVTENKRDEDKTSAELGTEVAIAHAKQVHGSEGMYTKPTRDQVKRAVDVQSDGKLPNGKAPDDEFWTAYDQAFDRETQQLDADALDDEERLRRVEKALGLLSPRQ